MHLLPIYASEQEIVETIRNHQVVVIEGPTGSGKTTQIPQILCKHLNISCLAVTQPRRIAAVSVARRIAKEQGAELGTDVGYAIRFDDQSSEHTQIRVMTDGILLMEARTDPYLERYDMVMVDEAHERSLNIDVILGILHALIQKRIDFRVVISSATLFPKQFQDFFEIVAGDVPVVSIAHRPFPIETHYRPLNSGRMEDVIQATVHQALAIHRRSEPGHILAFLPGAGEIRKAVEETTQHANSSDLLVLPLYARLTLEEQERVFEQVEGKRKIIYATNIAETSITIPDVRHVIDCGLAKLPRFSIHTGMTTIREEPISLASIKQRSGRAGRTAPGAVWRLYAKASLESRPEFTREEILRLDLAEVCLRLIDLGIGDIEHFPFPSPPPSKKIAAAIQTLEFLGAVDKNRQLTSIGRQMVPFPLPPSMARMVIEAAKRFPTVVDEVLVVGAFLSSRSPFVLPVGEVEAARKAHRHFFHPLGDAVSHVRIFKAFSRAHKKDRFCEKNYLDLESMEFAKKAHEQLIDIALQQGIAVHSGGPPEHIVRSVAAGLADRVIIKNRGAYETLSGVRVFLHPTSTLHSAKWPLLAVAAELVTYARAYAIHVSALRREWLKEINPAAAKTFKTGKSNKGHDKERREKISLPNQLQVGRLKLTVKHGRGKPVVEVALENLSLLKDLTVLDLPPEAKKIRVSIQWTPTCAFAAEPWGRMLRILKVAQFPKPGSKPPKHLAVGQLMELDRDHHALERALRNILKPAILKKNAGWIAFVANGAGGYWLDVVSHYRDALQASMVSLETLSDQIYDGDPLQSRVQHMLTHLNELWETLHKKIL